MEKTMERNAFEYLYESRTEMAKENQISPEYEEGVLKGIVDMAFMAGIITNDEVSKCYKDIFNLFWNKQDNQADDLLKKAE